LKPIEKIAQYKESVKKLSIQIKIGLLLMFAVILLSATCYLSYRNLSSIASSIRIDLNPELRMASIREISHDLETADNSIRIYTITRDTSDLRPYYSVIDDIDGKVNKLELECINDSIMLNQVDTISNLIEENIVIWNELLYFINNDNIIEYLKQLSDRINEAPENKEKKGILKRVFARNNDYLLKEQELIGDIEKIEEQGRITKSNLEKRESQLAATGSRIREKFYDLMTRMENQVSAQVREKSQAVNQIAESTYKWLITFSVSGGLLVLLVLFIIIRYIRDAHAYQLALERSKIETENLARAKEMFMANISHEIRTPVTAISGFAEQLLHDTSDKDILRSLKIIKSSSDHLAKITDDILDLSKLENGKLKLEKINFSIEQIFGEVYTIFKGQAQKNDTRISYSIAPGTPPLLLGDPYRLKQIMINLVGNSVKFTENGSVYFSAGGIKDDYGSVDLELEFADSGIGIDEDKLKIIFDDFTQAEMSTARKYGGTGLGLSIVRKLVNLHHGSIECKSRKGHGTTITCHLPFLVGREDQNKRDSILPVTIPEEIKNLKILIADDEEYNRLLFKKIFDRWGIKCDQVPSGMDAIEILKKSKYDILFMDIRMPGLDGYGTTHFIRNEMNIGEADMKVICVSAISPDEERTEFRKAGMDAFLKKPVSEKTLLAIIMAVRQNSREIITDNSLEEDKDNSSGKHRINPDNLCHISGGDEQFVKQMLVSFNNTTGKGLNEMLKAALSGEWNSVADIAHKMLPPCRHLGATDLYDIISKIKESISRKTDGQEIETMVRESLAEFESVREIVNEYIAKLE
jgi:signal transduction histidine kinase/CheY-like chemotaxis protein/HPt (histidine-containing phosphotransfer) domain-containing protein